MLLKHTHREYHYWKATQSQRLLKNKKKKIYLPRIYIDDYPCTCPLMWCLAADVPTWKKIKKKEKNCSEQREQHATEESARTYVSIKYQQKKTKIIFKMKELSFLSCASLPVILHGHSPWSYTPDIPMLSYMKCNWRRRHAHGYSLDEKESSERDVNKKKDYDLVNLLRERYPFLFSFLSIGLPSLSAQ